MNYQEENIKPLTQKQKELLVGAIGGGVLGGKGRRMLGAGLGALVSNVGPLPAAAVGTLAGAKVGARAGARVTGSATGAGVGGLAGMGGAGVLMRPAFKDSNLYEATKKSMRLAFDKQAALELYKMEKEAIFGINKQKLSPGMNNMLNSMAKNTADVKGNIVKEIPVPDQALKDVNKKIKGKPTTPTAEPIAIPAETPVPPAAKKGPGILKQVGRIGTAGAVGAAGGYLAGEKKRNDDTMKVAYTKGINNIIKLGK